MNSRIIVVVRVPGFHRWPDALPAVSFLSAQHRHMFTIRVEFVVSHADRQREFFITQAHTTDVLNKLWPRNDNGYEFGASSCEHIAAALLNELHATAVEVWEDDENGARVEA